MATITIDDSKAQQQRIIAATAAIQKSHRLLSSTDDLSPCNSKVTEALTELVQTLTHCQCHTINDCLLHDDALRQERESLPNLCGKAECAMEKYWTRRLLAEETLCLRDFWYIAEYEALCRAEAELLADKVYTRITFLGSGALPLTAILLAGIFPQARVTCIDMDPEACALSAELIKKAGLSHQIEVVKKNAADHEPDKNELVICAALLQDVEKVYNQISRQPGCDLIVRDSEGIYQFLYRPATLPDSRFIEVRKTLMNASCINTSHLYQQAA